MSPCFGLVVMGQVRSELNRSDQLSAMSEDRKQSASGRRVAFRSTFREGKEENNDDGDVPSESYVHWRLARITEE